MLKQVAAVTAVVVLAAGAAACGRNGSKQVDKAPMETQTASTPPNAGPMTLTVTGCLGAGGLADTYVLTSARTNGAAETTTYQLEGVKSDQLRGHIGERVQVSGSAIPEADIASNSTPAQEQKAKGTSGTPTVQTHTDLQIQRLRVDSVVPQGDKCPAK